MDSFHKWIGESGGCILFSYMPCPRTYDRGGERRGAKGFALHRRLVMLMTGWRSMGRAATGMPRPVAHPSVPDASEGRATRPDFCTGRDCPYSRALPSNW